VCNILGFKCDTEKKKDQKYLKDYCPIVNTEVSIPISVIGNFYKFDEVGKLNDFKIDTNESMQVSKFQDFCSSPKFINGSFFIDL
jgi:hypothetical protein